MNETDLRQLAQRIVDDVRSGILDDPVGCVFAELVGVYVAAGGTAPEAPRPQGKTRFWVRWYSVLTENEINQPWPCWLTGQTMDEPEQGTFCAVIDAVDEAEAWAIVGQHYKVVEQSFCNPRPADWMPGQDRFPR